MKSKILEIVYKITKKKWSKRVRGYFKSQTKKILPGETE